MSPDSVRAFLAATAPDIAVIELDSGVERRRQRSGNFLVTVAVASVLPFPSRASTVHR